MKTLGFFIKLLLVMLSSSLISCESTVDFGFPFIPPAGSTSRLEVTPANPGIPIGSTQQFTATLAQANGTSTDVTSQSTWTSADTSVATVNSSGLATALHPGTTVITATQGNASGNTTLTVTSGNLSSLSITPTNSTLPAGFTLQLTATGTFSDGTISDITKQVTWSSSNNSIAIVGGTGIVSGIAPGTAIITATSRGILATTTVTVTRVTLASISVSPSNPSIPGAPVGITQQFTATGVFSDGTNLDITSQVAWSSSNLSVATISSVTTTTTTAGLATSVGPGISTITATFQTISRSTILTVTSQALTSITVTPGNSNLHPGGTQQFTATATYSDGSSRDITSQVTWRSDNIAVATVNSTGLATAVAAGTATITAASGSFSGSAVLTVS